MNDKESITVKFIVKIKDEHNPPEFKEGLGKGVIAIQEMVITPKDNDPIINKATIAMFLVERSDEILKEYCEVTMEEIEEPKDSN